MTESSPCCARVLTVALLCAGLATSAQAADDGLVKCQISENSKSASGTMVLKVDGKTVAEGTCGDRGVTAPAGKYTAVLGLDGALDAPEVKRSVTVTAGQTTSVNADFATGDLQLEFVKGGKPAAGMAVIRKNGKQIGTLASGVSGHLSAGRYELTARYRSQQKDLGSIVVTAGAQKKLRVEFE